MILRLVLAIFTIFFPLVVRTPQGFIDGQANYYLGGHYLKPAQNLTVVLATVDPEIGWAWAGSDSPRATTDMLGAFEFQDLEEGWYAFALESPWGPWPLVDAVDGVCWAFYVDSDTEAEARIAYPIAWLQGNNIESAEADWGVTDTWEVKLPEKRKEKRT